MKSVAKLIIQSGSEYLMLERSNHPTFGFDPDLPGGTAERGESELETMLREAKEEIGLVVNPSEVHKLYACRNYSNNGTHYSLFLVTVQERITPTLSWEHSSYEWLNETEFIETSRSAKDTYMHMVADVLEKSEK